MVDKINPLNQLQNLQQTANKSHKSAAEQKTEGSYNVVDEVVISKAALDHAQVENTAKQASAQLSSDEKATLSSDIERLSALI